MAVRFLFSWVVFIGGGLFVAWLVIGGSWSRYRFMVSTVVFNGCGFETTGNGSLVDQNLKTGKDLDLDSN